MIDTASFITLCRAQTTVVTELITVLKDERDALIQSKTTALPVLSERKSKLLNLISQLEHERQTLGLHSLTTMRAWLTHQPKEACQGWLALEDALKRAAALNHINGCLIERGLQSTQHALTLLKSAVTATLGYSQDGKQPDLIGTSRLLGLA